MRWLVRRNLRKEHLSGNEPLEPPHLLSETVVLGSIAQEQGDYDEARRLNGEALTIYEQLGHQGGRSVILGQLAIIALLQGKYDEARRLYSENLALEEQFAHPRGQAIIPHQLGFIAHLQWEGVISLQLFKAMTIQLAMPSRFFKRSASAV